MPFLLSRKKKKEKNGETIQTSNGKEGPGAKKHTGGKRKGEEITRGLSTP